MKIHENGRNLIFLISLPRSGSTLLQHILGSHSLIHTLPEPWFMLHFVYGMREVGIETEYNAEYAFLALRDFLNSCQKGDDLYYQVIREGAMSLYEAALIKSGKHFFLDKTPRYYLIIPELQRIFPDAKFIFLLRNPIAVFTSILDVNFKGNWQKLFEHKDRKQDLFNAPKLLLDGINLLGDRAKVIHYEQLVRDPANVVEELCEYLGVSYDTEILNYGGKVGFTNTTFVDPKSIYKHEHPVKDYIDSWTTRLDTPQKLYLAKAYISELGEELLAGLGYENRELMEILDSIKPPGFPLVVPWELIHFDGKKTWWYRFKRFILISCVQFSFRSFMATIKNRIRRIM